MTSANSDRERSEEFCAWTHHQWREEYYGLRCDNCGMFIPYGSEPWLPLDDEGNEEDESVQGVSV